MLEEGSEQGEAGTRAFADPYGLLEKTTGIEPTDNGCSNVPTHRRSLCQTMGLIQSMRAGSRT